MKYRAEIDGLRALAVLPVILFHAGYSTFAGGFVGVDVFFVISGFLITSIIYEEISQDRFSIISFYERRARRLLPALFLVCSVSIPFAWAWMLPESLDAFFESLLATNLFLSNVYFWSSSDYFGIAAEHMPLLHTWSLAVEEQFYVFFPLVLLALRRLGWSWTLVSILLLSVLSLGLAQWASSRFPSANFYLLPTRVWELGLGAALSLWCRNQRIRSALLRSIGALTGFGLICFAIIFFDEATPFPSLYALFPVFGTLMILACADSQNFVGRFLSLRPMVFLGLISYSAYLWHQPLFAFARIRSLDEPSKALMLILALSSLILAFFSWKFVEIPFRKRQLLDRKKIFVFSVLATFGLGAFSILGNYNEGFPGRVPSEVLEYAQWNFSRNPRAEHCLSDSNNPIAPNKACKYGDKQNAKIAIWGDSHASALADQIGEKLNPHGQGLIEMSFSGCAPVVGVAKKSVPGCTKYNSDVLAYLLDSQQIDMVILHARWTLFIEQERYDNQEGGIEPGAKERIFPIENQNVRGLERISALTNLLQAQVKMLQSSGKRVVLLYPIPEVGWHVPKYLAKKSWFTDGADTSVTTSVEVYRQRVRNTLRFLDAIQGPPSIIKIKPAELICEDINSLGRCNATLNGVPLYSDDDHLSRFGANLVSKNVVARILKIQ